MQLVVRWVAPSSAQSVAAAVATTATAAAATAGSSYDKRTGSSISGNCTGGTGDYDHNRSDNNEHENTKLIANEYISEQNVSIV